MGISTVPSALKSMAEDLIVRAKHVEELDARLQSADALAEAVNTLLKAQLGEGAYTSGPGFKVQEALKAYRAHNSICGIPVVVDPSLQPGEWRLEQ